MSFDFSDFHSKSGKTIEHVQEDVATLRTGRATAQLLDSVIVLAYGAMMKIPEVAQVSAPDPNMLVVKPWDQSLLGSVEKAITIAGLNLSPVVDGQIIRIVVPALTEERRKEMVKMLFQKVESGKVMIRTIRTYSKHDIEKQKGEADISEDDIHRDLEKLDELVQEYIDKLDAITKQKETELLTV